MIWFQKNDLIHLVVMVKFKTDSNISIYYTDTDSLFVDKPLEDKNKNKLNLHL
uniref:DNA polymerase n=1 Tax=Hericium alpestre TaxID=135208 RepID=UPI002435D9A5|nr:DNA polymerase [Hericium alpestre]WEX32000.1 DNA polymerase [Hericium alpestre]